MINSFDGGDGAIVGVEDQENHLSRCVKVRAQVHA